MAVSINVNYLGEHRSMIGPADGVDWIITALITAIRDNADWLETLTEPVLEVVRLRY